MQMINIITMTSVMMMIIIIQKGEFFMKEYARVRHFANTVMFPVNKAQKRMLILRAQNVDSEGTECCF